MWKGSPIFTCHNMIQHNLLQLFLNMVYGLTSIYDLQTNQELDLLLWAILKLPPFIRRKEAWSRKWGKKIICTTRWQLTGQTLRTTWLYTWLGNFNTTARKYTWYCIYYWQFLVFERNTSSYTGKPLNQELVITRGFKLSASRIEGDTHWIPSQLGDNSATSLLWNYSKVDPKIYIYIYTFQEESLSVL